MLPKCEIKEREEILPILVGKDSFNKDVIVDLCQLPHLLISGASGQGKTVFLNSIITSLLCKSSELKFVFIDPKIIELPQYNKLNKKYIAQLRGEEDAVITDCDTAKRTLESLNEEKDNRYWMLHKAKVKSIVEYNDKLAKGLISPKEDLSPIPYIVIVIDEFADLMYMFGEEIERQLFRIATLGCAVGIHLVLTTVRPSEEVITDYLKYNFPARIAFRMNQVKESMRVIDCEDAVCLKSSGDMLFSYSGSVNHLKGTFIDSHEIESIIESANNYRSYSKPYILPCIDENSNY